jgi:hypothetical protein
MTELKTRPGKKSVRRFLDSVDHPVRKNDSFRVLEMMEEVTGEKATMWGDSIVGFGWYLYKNSSGRELEWMLTGFSPRKQNLVVYIMPGFSRYGDVLNALGKHKLGRSCLYLNKLDDVNFDKLKELVAGSVDEMRRKYDCK